MSALSKVTPGQAAHNAWCAEDDWDQLDSEARSLWETAAQAAIAAAAAVRTAIPGHHRREMIMASNAENDDPILGHGCGCANCSGGNSNSK